MTVTVVDAGPRRVCRSVEVAAPAAELFAMAADPRRHHELDGSGTVRDNIKVPAELAVGSKFSTSMKMYGAAVPDHQHGDRASNRTNWSNGVIRWATAGGGSSSRSHRR